MKKLLSLTLALALTLSLAAPALAAEPETEPLTAVQVLDSLGALDDAVVVPAGEEPYAYNYEELQAAWIDAHPDEVAAFDADVWFAGQMGDYLTKEQYLSYNHLTEEEFRAEMLESYVIGQVYLDQQRAEIEEFRAGHPGALDGFDPDAYFAEHYDYYESKEEYLELHTMTEEDFQVEMTLEYVQGIQLQEENQQRIADYEAANPGGYAAFDADAWFAGHYNWYDKQTYLDAYGLDEAGFREDMFLEYLYALDEEEARRQTVADYLAAHPGALDGFDPMSYLSNLGYPDPTAAFMEDYGLTSEESVVEYLQYDYVTNLMYMEQRRAYIAEYEAEHPGATAAFDADAYFEENYFYYDKDEFMAQHGLETEEDFRDYLLYAYLFYQDNGWSHGGYDSQKEALGGVPGELGVMVNGVYLTFADKKPYAQDGATYVPADVLAGALGQEPPTVTTNGYAPLRASAEAAGYTVYWDPDYETAVLLSPAALAGELDEQFTILNAALAQWDRDPEKNYKTSCTVAIDATLFNSIDGDKTYAMTAALEALTAPEGTAVSGKYDLSAVKDLLRDALGEELYGYLTEDGGAEMDALLDLLSKGDFQIRYDAGTGTLYLTASSFPSLFSIMGKTYPKDVWLSWESAAGAPAGTPTVGAGLAAFSLNMAELDGTAPVYYYQTAAEYGRMCASVLGDANFEKKGDDQVLSLDAAELGSLFYELLGYDEYYFLDYFSFKELSLELTVKADGTVTGSFAARPESVLSALADLRISGDWSLDGTHEDATIEYHLKNQFKVTVTIESDTRPTGQKPETTPPAKAAVVPMDEVTG